MYVGAIHHGVSPADLCAEEGEHTGRRNQQVHLSPGHETQHAHHCRYRSSTFNPLFIHLHPLFIHPPSTNSQSTLHPPALHPPYIQPLFTVRIKRERQKWLISLLKKTLKIHPSFAKTLFHYLPVKNGFLAIFTKV